MKDIKSTNSKNYIPALGYDWLTGFYDLAIKLTMPEGKFRNRLIDQVAPGEDETILEFGFGTGENIILAQQRNPKTTFVGVDIDSEVRNIAARKLQRNEIDVRLDLYDGIKLPYPDNTYNKIFSSLVFHQLDKKNKLACLREIYRVLKPGGKLIIGDWGKAKSGMMRIAFFAVQLLDGFKNTTDNVKGLLPEYIEHAGFNRIRETGYINTKIGSFCYYQAEK